MIPQYLGSADKQLREGELLLLEALLRQVTVITKMHQTKLFTVCISIKTPQKAGGICKAASSVLR